MMFITCANFLNRGICVMFDGNKNKIMVENKPFWNWKNKLQRVNDEENIEINEKISKIRIIEYNQKSLSKIHNVVLLEDQEWFILE